jgi:hypothetical protein
VTLPQGIGNSISFGLGAIDLVAVSGGLCSSQVQGLSVAGSLVCAVLSAVTLVLAKEEPLPPPPPPPPPSSRHAPPDDGAAACAGCASGLGQQLCSLRTTFQAFPHLLKLVFCVQFLTSLGKNGALMFVTDCEPAVLPAILLDQRGVARALLVDSARVVNEPGLTDDWP